MTGVLEAPTELAAPRPVASRGGGRARWRVAFRLARRQVWRARLSSLLIVVLIALPIAAMSAYIVIAMSAVGTPQERARAELGRMQAWVAPRGIPGKGFWQSPTDPGWNGYPPTGGMSGNAGPEGTPLADPVGSLPASAETILVTDGSVRVETAAGTTLARAWAGPTWDPRFAGRFDLVDGRRPRGVGEAVVTPAALARLGIPLGGALTLADSQTTLTVVGTMRAATLGDAETAVFLPATQRMHELVPGTPTWYLPDTALSWSDVQELNEDGIVAYSRDVVLDPPEIVQEDGLRLTDQSASSATLSLVIVLVLSGLAAAYVVVMLAGAAFAVTARRQQRSLAIAASVGAGRRDLSRTILLQGTTLGAVGGVGGIGLGIGLAALLLSLIGNGSATQFWGFHVPWAILAGVLVFAVAVGTASAFMPARALARTDTIGALRGARRPQRPTASRPVWGSLLLVVGIAVTITSAVVTAAVVGNGDIPWNSPLRAVPPFGIVIGPILVQVGILVSGRWLLWLAARLLSRVGLAARVAARDAAANAGRTVPAFAAVGAVVFLGVLATGQSAMQTAETARMWFYTAPVGSVGADFWPGASNSSGFLDDETADAAADAADDMLRGAGATGTAVIRKQQMAWRYASPDDVPADSEFALAVLPDRYLLDGRTGSYRSLGLDPSNNLAIVEPGELETVLGIALSATDLAAYRAGAAVVADHRLVTDGHIDVSAWTGREQYGGLSADNIFLPSREGPRRADPLWSRDVDAIEVNAPHQPTMAAIAPQTASAWGLTSQPEHLVASFDEPPTTAILDRLDAELQLASATDYGIGVRFEQGPPSDAGWMIPLLSVVAILVLGASSVALGLARFERRPDDATLAAVGGTPALRRRVAFCQGLLIAGFGTIAGAVAGVLPPIGFAIQSQGSLSVADIPWLVLGTLAIGLPLVIAIANALVPPRHPDLTRRTAIA